MPGRPPMAREVRDLIQAMWRSNPTWGAPRIVGELRKLGIKVAKSTVDKYRTRPKKPPSPAWKTFLKNHMQGLVALVFFVVPTVTLRVLFVLMILAHARRRVVHLNVTELSTAQWTAQQVVEAFPWDGTPRCPLRDRDRIYGSALRQRVRHMDIEEVLIAPCSPWQNPYVERLIGSIRRQCLDHVIVLPEHHLRRILTDYFAHYHTWRAHLALDKEIQQMTCYRRFSPIGLSSVYLQEPRSRSRGKAAGRYRENLFGHVNAEDANMCHRTCLITVNGCPSERNHAGS